MISINLSNEIQQKIDLEIVSIRIYYNRYADNFYFKTFLLDGELQIGDRGVVANYDFGDFVFRSTDPNDDIATGSNILNFRLDSLFEGELIV